MRGTRAAMSSGETSSRLATGVAVIVIGALQFSIALAAARRPAEASIIVVGVVAVVCAIVFPRALLVLALLSTMFAERVGPASLNLSVTDAVGALGLIAALRFVPWGDRRVRMVMGGLAIYLGTLAVGLLVHHPQRAVLEWAHRGVLFGGSILIGVAIVQSGITRPALRIFMGAVGVLGVVASLEALRTGFEPAYVFHLQKNHAGLLLAVGFLVAFVAGPQLAWSHRVLVCLRVVTLLGLVATQSRAAALGLVAALALRPLLLGRRGNQRAASIGILLLSLVLLAGTAVSLNNNDLNRTVAEQQFNSINTRTNVYRQAIDDVWLPDVFTGGGLRYFMDSARFTGAPHNVVIGELAESGLLGLAGLVVLLGATALALRRSPSPLALLGLMALTLRATQSMAEIFWVAGPLTVVVVLAGMGLTRGPDEAEPSIGSAATVRHRSSSRLPAQGWLS